MLWPFKEGRWKAFGSLKRAVKENCEGLKKSLEDGKTSHVHRLVELILWQ